MKLVSKRIVRTNSSGKDRSIDIIMLKNLNGNKLFSIKGYSRKIINSSISVYYMSKIIFIWDLTYKINYVIIAVVKRTAIIQ